MRLHLRDAPVPSQRLQAQVLGVQLEPTRQLHGAHHRVGRQLGPNHFGLGGQEGVVEAHVVGDECATAQKFPEGADDVAEARLALEHLGGQAVHMGGPGVDARVEQAVQRLFDVAVVTERQRRDADDAGLPGAEAGCLDVDDDPARPGFGCRPAPGLAHVLRMACRSDITGSLHSVSST